MTGLSVRALSLTVVVMAVAPVTAQAETLRVRKDALALTAKEKHQFVQAMHALKAADYPYDDDPDGIRWYDQLVQWHVELTPCNEVGANRHGIWGHGGPMFLPWHRQYLLMLEDALREVSKKHISIPYWDWTNDASTDAVLSDDLMGGTGNAEQGYRLESGPFSHDKWRLHIDNTALYGYYLMSSEYITRNIGSPYQDKLTVKDDLPFAMSRPVFDTAPWSDASDARQSFRMALEGSKDNHDPITGSTAQSVAGCTGPTLGKGAIVLSPGAGTLHNQVHTWVGGATAAGPEGGSLMGTMTVPLASPNDPIFFLHHANIDRLWAEWQKAHPDDPYRPRGTGDETFPENEIDDQMHPWPATPRDVADTEALGVTYAAPGQTSVKKVARRGVRRKRAQLLCRLRRL